MAAGPPALPSDKANLQHAAGAVADQIVAALPNDIHLRLLAIADFEGDDGTLVDALTTRIKAGTRFRLIERRDLDKILSEQGITLSPIGDPRAPAEPGRIKGVEGLMMGKVSRTSSILFSNMEVFVKLDNVESGEVVLAQSFKALYIPPSTKYGFIGIGIVVVLVFVIRQKRQHVAHKGHRRAGEDAAALDGIVVQLKKVRQNINQAHDTLVERKALSDAVAVKEVRDELNQLITKVELDPGLQPSSADRNAAKNLAANAKSLKALVTNLTAEAEKLLNAVKGGENSLVRAALETVKTEIKNTRLRFADRIG
jgi:hypothetical protein